MTGKKMTKRKGFTLIELIVSIFVFLIIMTGIVSIFASQIRAYRHARVSQNDLENAQFAMNYLAKTFRTATILGEGNSASGGVDIFENDLDWDGDFQIIEIEEGNKLILYDFSQELCMRFYYDVNTDKNNKEDKVLWVESQSEIDFNQIEECVDPNTYVPGSKFHKLQRLTSGDVTGSFWVSPTRYQEQLGSSQTDAIGRVTFGMTVQPSKNNAMRDKIDPIYIQTSVSLRDYPPDLSF